MRYIVANWKQNGSRNLIDDFKTITPPPLTTLIIAPPAPLLNYAAAALPNAKLSAQDCSPHTNGAYTSQLSACLLREEGCDYVIVGHSETRMYQRVTAQDVYQKATCALDANLTPIICIGESESDYNAHQTQAVLRNELEIFKPLGSKIIIAYEPLWAIGTGKTPTPEEINSTLAFIKSIVSVPTLYGGSVNENNAKDFLNLTHVDGLLIGGASLKPEIVEKITQIS